MSVAKALALKTMKVLGLIPARGGSKGVPRKNLHLLLGKPLLWYTARAAQASIALSQTVLSTDDEEIAAVGREYGLHVPFLRPAELAQDATPTLPVLQHAVRWLEDRGERFDAVCLLQPTAPLRTAQDIDECVAQFAQTNADCLVTMLPVPEKYNPHWVYFADDAGKLRLSTGEATPIPRRQQLPPAYHREGSIYITRRDVLMEQNSLYGTHVVGHLMDPSRSVNIDHWHDFERAEQLLLSEQLEPQCKS
jgi:CMP-N-acetylneuraminic acid synthetase